MFNSPETTTIDIEAINGGIAILNYYIAEAPARFHSASDGPGTYPCTESI